NAWPISVLGHAYAVAGKRDQALQLLDVLTERSTHEYIHPGAFAFLYTGLGENDLAFAQLEKAYEEHSDDGLLQLKAHPGWDRLSADPRFTDLLRRVGLEQKGFPRHTLALPGCLLEEWAIPCQAYVTANG